jgi:hypothetical protein
VLHIATLVSGSDFFCFVIPLYLQSVPVNSANRAKAKSDERD